MQTLSGTQNLIPNSLEQSGRKFVLSIDLAGGGGGDFTVMNVFKVVPLPRK
jgi:hypothetical protein